MKYLPNRSQKKICICVHLKKSHIYKYVPKLWITNFLSNWKKISWLIKFLVDFSPYDQVSPLLTQSSIQRSKAIPSMLFHYHLLSVFSSQSIKIEDFICLMVASRSVITIDQRFEGTLSLKFLLFNQLEHFKLLLAFLSIQNLRLYLMIYCLSQISLQSILWPHCVHRMLFT